MKGLIKYPKIKEGDLGLDELIRFARKNREVNVAFLTPGNQLTYVRLEVTKRPKSWIRVLMDMWPSNFDISLVG